LATAAPQAAAHTLARTDPAMATELSQSKREVAAANRGPGPATYQLPSDFGNLGKNATKRGAAAFSMGVNAKPSEKERSPGPKYNYDHTLTPRGAHNQPAYSMAGRHAAKPKDVTPCPNQYGETAPVTTSRVRRAPAFTMGQRKFAADDTITPGPNTFVPPSLMTKSQLSTKSTAAAFTMGGRIASAKNKGQPGPADYAVVGFNGSKRNVPAVTIAGRHKTKANKEVTPPATKYNPQIKSKVKGGVFGTRHSDFVYIPHAK